MEKRKKRYITIFIIIMLSVTAAIFAWYWRERKDHGASKEIKEFTAFFDVPGGKLDEDNEIKNKIAELVGARCIESWLSGQADEMAVNQFMASGEYPDFISSSTELYEAGALIPIDLYWDDYPNVKNYMQDYEWDRLRLDDGHIYWIPQFGVLKVEPEEVIHEGEAFWIQTRVLKWANYPEIHTLQEYFDLLERYMEANPTMENGTPNIPYTILCDGWRYFCLENVPQFLDGYPNDGSCIVDPVTQTVKDYNVTPTAKKYFEILNTEYQKGIIDPESFTQTYEEYIEKLSTGAVLGMVDQGWQFLYTVEAALERQKLIEQGCSYVPLPITIDENVKNQWHVRRSNELDVSKGISITVSCQDIAGAMQFINDLLEPEVQQLRFWGEEGIDYEVDEDGKYYRTPVQRTRVSSPNLKASHYCSYAYFPRIEGMMPDGINAFSAEYQPGECYAALPVTVRECLEAYDCRTYVDMLGTNEQPGIWYPMYSYSTMLTRSTKAGRTWEQMEDTKHTWLPQVVMSENFEETWQCYMGEYEACSPEIFFADMQKELERRIGEK